MTVLLVRCRHVGAAGLKSALLELRSAWLVAEYPHGPEAVNAAEKHRPALILVGCDGINEATTDLLKNLRTASPESRIVAFSDDIDLESVRMVVDSGVTGYLKWTDVSTESLGPMLELALAGMWIGSGEAVAKLAADRERRNLDELNLSAEERLLVEALNEDTRPRDMGKQIPLSARTRQRTRKRLLERFEVQTDYMLGKHMAAYAPDP
jgi:DNA-binding NarL/FixJ family response regulator